MKPADQAANVTIHDWRGLIEGYARNGACSVAADARQVYDFRHRRWKLSLVSLDDHLRGQVQVARAAVVSKPGPYGYDLLLFRAFRAIKPPEEAARVVL